MKKIVFIFSILFGLVACGAATENGTNPTGENNSGALLNFLNGSYTLTAKSTTEKGNNGVICAGDATGIVTFVTDESGTFLKSTMTGSVTDSNGVIYSLDGSAVPGTSGMKGSFTSSNSSAGEFTILLASFDTSTGGANVGVFKDNFGCRGDLYVTEKGTALGDINSGGIKNDPKRNRFDDVYEFTATADTSNNADCAASAAGSLVVKDLVIIGSARDSDGLNYALKGTIDNGTNEVTGSFVAQDGSSIGSFTGDFIDVLEIRKYEDIFNCKGRWVVARLP